MLVVRNLTVPKRELIALNAINLSNGLQISFGDKYDNRLLFIEKDSTGNSMIYGNFIFTYFKSDRVYELYMLIAHTRNAKQLITNEVNIFRLDSVIYELVKVGNTKPIESLDALTAIDSLELLLTDAMTNVIKPSYQTWYQSIIKADKRLKNPDNYHDYIQGSFNGYAETIADLSGKLTISGLNEVHNDESLDKFMKSLSN